MTRTFRTDPVDPGAVGRITSAGQRAPSAGNSQGTHLLVLDTPAATARYWDASMPDAGARARFRWPTLLTAPVLVVVMAEPAAYVRRYGEDDKQGTGLGRDASAWPVPYWTVDASMAAMLVQLAALDEGLGVLFFGLFDRAPAVLAAFGVPAGIEAVGTIAVGHAGEGPDGRSAARARRPAADTRHRGQW